LGLALALIDESSFRLKMLMMVHLLILFSYCQGILYTGGRGWYRMCCRQPTVGLVVSKIKQNIFSAQTATF
jgi:hypothetical protein